MSKIVRDNVTCGKMYRRPQTVPRHPSIAPQTVCGRRRNGAGAAAHWTAQGRVPSPPLGLGSPKPTPRTLRPQGALPVGSQGSRIAGRCCCDANRFFSSHHPPSVCFHPWYQSGLHMVTTTEPHTSPPIPRGRAPVFQRHPGIDLEFYNLTEEQFVQACGPQSMVIFPENSFWVSSVFSSTGHFFGSEHVVILNSPN